MGSMYNAMPGLRRISDNTMKAHGRLLYICKCTELSKEPGKEDFEPLIPF